MSITVNQLNDEISTAPQLAPEHMAAVAAAGYRSVINNRPDFEGGADQPEENERDDNLQAKLRRHALSIGS